MDLQRQRELLTLIRENIGEPDTVQLSSGKFRITVAHKCSADGTDYIEAAEKMLKSAGLSSLLKTLPHPG